MKAVRHEVRPVAPRGPPGRSGWPRLHNHPQTSMGGGGSEPRGCQGALGAYGSIQHSRPRPQTAPPRAPHPAWARGAGVRSRYGLLWHSPADGYKMMARCLRSWHAAQVWMSKEYIYLLYAPPLRHVTYCCINRFRLLLDSRVVGFADVVQPNCCHPCLLEPLLFQASFMAHEK
jgi:hypothetical protein